MMWYHIIVWFWQLEGVDIHYILAALYFVYGLRDWNRMVQAD